MPSQESPPGHPSYKIVSGSNTADTITNLVVRRGQTHFHVRVDHELVRGTAFFAEYERQLLRVNEQVGQQPTGVAREVAGENGDPHDDICHLLLPLFERLAPDPVLKLAGMTVQDLLDTPTYTLQVLPGLHGSGEDVRVVGEGEGVTYTPKLCIAPRPLLEVPDSCAGVARVDARHVWIEPMVEGAGDPNLVWLAQGDVRLGDGRVVEFRPCHVRRAVRGLRDELDCMREMRTLGTIRRLGLTAGEVRLPTLSGLVVSGDRLVGMLIDKIPSSERGGSVIHKGCWEKPELCIKWERQVQVTLRALHDNGLVWGTPHPATVVIDRALDAWVVNFGGLTRDNEFVDAGLLETKAGDVQGVDALFKHWLPTRRVEVHGECAAGFWS